MVSHILTKRILPQARELVRSCHDHHGPGMVGSNLPFNIENKFRIVLYFTLFMGSGLTLPFFVAYRSTSKKV